MTRPVHEEQGDARDIAFIDFALVTDLKAALMASRSSHRLRIVVAVTVLVVLAAGLPVTLGSSATQLSTEDCVSRSVGVSTERLEHCVAVFPSDPELLADLAGRYEQSHQTARSEQLYRRALALDPDYADLRLRLGRLLLQQGKTEEARQQATAALQIQPNRTALIDLLQQAGDKAEGIPVR